MNKNSFKQQQGSEKHITPFDRAIREFLIDDALARSAKLRRISKRIRRAQQVLRGLCDDPAWDAYLKIEEATNARAYKELRLVLKKVRAALTPSWC